jgi:hypothetical protein
MLTVDELLDHALAHAHSVLVGRPQAERVRAWRDKKRGGPPRAYHKRQTAKGARQFGGPVANLKRAAAIRQTWDCPMRRAIMRRIKLEGK